GTALRAQQAVHRLFPRAIKEPDNGPPRAARQSRQRELAKGAALHWSRAVNGISRARPWLVYKAFGAFVVSSLQLRRWSMGASIATGLQPGAFSNRLILSCNPRRS